MFPEKLEGSISGNLSVQQRLTGSALFESLCSNCKMLGTSNIIVIIKIMAEFLKMCFAALVFQGGCKDDNDDLPRSCHHTETLSNNSKWNAMPKVLLVEPRTCNGFGLSRQWRGIALHLGDESGGLDLDRLVRVLFVVHTDCELVAVKIKGAQRVKIGGHCTVVTVLYGQRPCDSHHYGNLPHANIGRPAPFRS